MAFDWLIKTEYFVTYIPQNSNFWAQDSQDSRSCDEVTLVRPQVNQSVRTAGPVMFHNDCNKTSLAHANIDALYAGSLRLKISFLFPSNFTFYKWCVTKKAHCIPLDILLAL